MLKQVWNNPQFKSNVPADRVGQMTKQLKEHSSESNNKPLSNAQRDARLMRAISEHRDPNALSLLFQSYGPKLKGWLISRGVDAGTAEDVIQDVMIRVWTKAGKFDPEKASFVTWVYRLTRNRWIDFERKHKRVDVKEPAVINILADDYQPSAENDYSSQQNAQKLYSEISNLKIEQTELINMAFMKHMTHAEIAKQTGLPLGTVKTRIRSGLQELKKNITRDEICL